MIGAVFQRFSDSEHFHAAHEISTKSAFGTLSGQGSGLSGRAVSSFSWRFARRSSPSSAHHFS